MINVPTVEVTQVPDPLPEGVTVLDVREPIEWRHGRIDGAVHIPIGEIADRVDEIAKASDGDQVLVVCKVGGRSAQVTAYLRQLGLDAVNLEGGMVEWSAAGRPMVGDGDGDPLVV